MKRRRLRDSCRCGGVLDYFDAGPEGFRFVCLSCDKEHVYKDTAFLAGGSGAGQPRPAPRGDAA